MSNGLSLRAVGLTKTFGKGSARLPILTDLDFVVAAGESVSVVGRSGAGKSTLLYTLSGLDLPSAGEVYFDEVALKNMRERELANFRNRNIGFVFQFHHLLKDFSALENVAMPLMVARQSRLTACRAAAELLTRVGLGERLNHRPGELSGGEQQRVAIARALVRNPRIVFADEPTGNLDKANALQVLELLLDLNKQMGCTLVIVTHNEQLAEMTARSVRLDEGKIVAYAAVA